MSQVGVVQTDVWAPSLQEQQATVKAHEESPVVLTQPPAPVRQGRQSYYVFLSTEGLKRGAVPFPGSSEQSECDIPRACWDEAEASWEAEVLLLRRGMPTGPATSSKL